MSTPDSSQDPTRRDAFLTGHHCSLPNCNALSFLPIHCPSCTQFFCSSHGSPPDQHACPAAVSRTVAGEDLDSKRWKDEGRSFKDLLPAQPGVAVVKPVTPEEAAKAAKKAAARELLNRHFPSTAAGVGSGTAKTKGPSGKKPLSPALKLMQLKRRAVSGDPRKKEGDVSMDFRWYGSVRWVAEGELSLDKMGEEEMEGKPVWFEKTIVTGKALDLLCSLLKVPSASSSAPDSLFVPARRKALALPQALSSQVEMGDIVWIVRGDWLTEAVVDS